VRRPGWRSAGALALLLAIAGLSGCEESQACFPLTASCTDAASFSQFFAPDVPCCEGTCTAQPPDPSAPNVPILICE
jgi:hypothetical protein